MIESKLGEVKITRPNYELCDLLGCSSSDVDMVVEATIGADLTAILNALASVYGTEHAMEMWTRSAELYIKTMKGENNEREY